jgi:hypothetical protein
VHIPATPAQGAELAGFMVVVTLGHCNAHVFSSPVLPYIKAIPESFN